MCKWESAVIPLGQEIIKDNAHVVPEICGYFTTGFVDLVNNMDKSFQSGLGAGFFHQFFDEFAAGEDHALASAGNMREETVFAGVVFRAIGWIVSNANFDPDFIGQCLQVLLEDVVAGTVTPAAIAKHENRSGVGIVVVAVCVPPMAKAIASEFTGIMTAAELDVADIETQVVETVRNADPSSIAVEIMVISLQFFQGVQRVCG